MSKHVVAECTSTTEPPDGRSLAPPKSDAAAGPSARDRWWSPAMKKLRCKSYTCELYVQMRQRLNKINRRSKSLLPPANLHLEEEDPGGVITESYVTKFSMLRSLFDISDEKRRNYLDENNRKASFNEVDAWINQFDAPAHSTVLEKEETTVNWNATMTFDQQNDIEKNVAVHNNYKQKLIYH